MDIFVKPFWNNSGATHCRSNRRNRSFTFRIEKPRNAVFAFRDVEYPIQAFSWLACTRHLPIDQIRPISV